MTKDKNPYEPHSARILKIHPQIQGHRLFQVKFEDDEIARSFSYKPGQFMEVTVFGSGEAPFSISSSPTRPGIIEFCIRQTGKVTNALFNLSPNSQIGMRGPYGNGFPVETLENNDLLIVAGGLGMAPLRSLLWYILDTRKKFGEVILMYGGRNPDDMLFKYELLDLLDSPEMQCLLTVDRDDSGIWPAIIGPVTALFDRVKVVPDSTFAAICGPPIMYKYVLEKLFERNFSSDRILMSLERHMKCGLGKCGHCAIGSKYVCLDGPIFSHQEALALPETV
jgi:NAD(P)H-flavin reductase